MQARDLAVKVPLVHVDDPLSRAVAIMADETLPGVIVVGHDDRPRFVLSDTQVLRLILAQYSDDIALARTIDEASADRFRSDLSMNTVEESLGDDHARPAQVPCDATALDVAIAMARLRTPLVAVVNAEGRLAGCITLNALLTATTPGPDE